MLDDGVKKDKNNYNVEKLSFYLTSTQHIYTTIETHTPLHVYYYRNTHPYTHMYITSHVATYIHKCT